MKIKIVKNVLNNPTPEEDITKYIGEIFEVVGDIDDGGKYIRIDEFDNFKIFEGEYELVEEESN